MHSKASRWAPLRQFHPCLGDGSNMLDEEFKHAEHNGEAYSPIVLHSVRYLTWVFHMFVCSFKSIFKAIELIKALNCVKVVQARERASLMIKKCNGQLTGILHSVVEILPHVCNLRDLGQQLNHLLHLTVQAVQSLFDEQHVQANLREVSSCLHNKLTLPRAHPETWFHAACSVVGYSITHLTRRSPKSIIDCFRSSFCTALREDGLESCFHSLKSFLQRVARQLCEQSGNMRELTDDSDHNSNQKGPNATPQSNGHACLCCRGVGCAEFVECKRGERSHQQAHPCQGGAALAHSEGAEPIDNSNNLQHTGVAELAREGVHQGVDDNTNNNRKKALNHRHHIRPHTRVDQKHSGDSARWHEIVHVDAEEKATHQRQPVARDNPVVIPKRDLDESLGGGDELCCGRFALGRIGAKHCGVFDHQPSKC